MIIMPGTYCILYFYATEMALVLHIDMMNKNKIYEVVFIFVCFRKNILFFLQITDVLFFKLQMKHGQLGRIRIKITCFY